MNTVLWILQIVLALAFVGAGLAKVVMPRARVRDTLGDWVDAFPAPALKLLGVAELAAAIGLIVPPLVHIAPVLTPLAAIGVVLVMAGAIVTHARRREFPNVAVNVVLAIAALVVAWGRFGPHAF
ncbi:DoxX family protein [Mycobacterium camsae]|uniref:DoxX family protein n=1 Tax=Mycobacterium gordonae TaxID=1778 RepID=UPI00197E3C3E|nr:DoxX family protein [Mycobacterium gordonae]